MVKIGEFFMIRELFQKGWTIKAIADKTGFDPKTIRKYTRKDQLPNKKASKKRPSKLDPFKS
ncbi:helix-turn-helix domain-containing protein, partial [Robertmurraya sp. DFI.2.37]